MSIILYFAIFQILFLKKGTKMQLIKDIIKSPISLKEDIDLEILKTRLNNFKKKPNKKLKKIIDDDKMILTYDDRLDTYFIFSNFLPQYGFYFRKTLNGIEIRFFPFENTSENVYIYILYLLHSLNIISQEVNKVESANV